MENQASVSEMKHFYTLLVKTAKTIAEQTRSPRERSLLFRNLINFNRLPVGVNTVVYPGLFGFRCRACGGTIDEHGVCMCGWDHFQKIKYPIL